MKFGKVFNKRNLVTGAIGVVSGIVGFVIAGLVTQDEEGADNNEVLVEGEPDPVVETEEVKE